MGGNSPDCRRPRTVRRYAGIGGAHVWRAGTAVCRGTRKRVAVTGNGAAHQWRIADGGISVCDAAADGAADAVIHAVPLGKQYPCRRNSWRSRCRRRRANAEIPSVAVSHAAGSDGDYCHAGTGRHC